MIECSLEDDIPEQYKGGTLSINSDELKSPTNNSAITDSDINTNVLIKSDKNGTTKLKYNQICETDDEKNEKEVKRTALEVSIKVPDNPNDFFSFREGVIEAGIRECSESFLDPIADGKLLASFLLTEINLWNTDKERLLLLTPNTLLIVKYDFIALKGLEFKKLPLNNIDTVIIGDLVYPKSSFVPRINGITEGVTGVLQNCLFKKWSENDKKTVIPELFRSRSRNMRGVRLMWNKGEPIKFSSRWNVFSKSVPLCTFTFHPLYFHKESDRAKNMYDVEEFIKKICAAITDSRRCNEEKETCIFHHKDIVLENYVGVGSVIHNQYSLGYFKVRGKFSF